MSNINNYALKQNPIIYFNAPITQNKSRTQIQT